MNFIIVIISFEVQIKKISHESLVTEVVSDSSSISSRESDQADPTYVQNCEISNCSNEVLSSCHICFDLLCYQYFMNTGPCVNYHEILVTEAAIRKLRNYQHQRSEGMLL